MWKILSLSLLFLHFSLHAAASWKGTVDGEFSADITLPRTDLTLEEFLQVAITLTYPESYSVDLGKLRKNLLTYVELSEPPFALVAEEIQPRSEGKIKILFSLEPQLIGTHFISLYKISFLPKDLEKDRQVDIISDIFSVTVSAPTIEKSFQGITAPLLSLTEKNPIEINPKNKYQLIDNPVQRKKEAMGNQTLFRQKSFRWGTFAGGVLLLGLVFLVARMQTKKKPGRGKKQSTTPLSARNKAVRSLKALEASDLIQEKQFDEYYSLLTGIVRNYLEEGFGLTASTQTTQEFLDTVIKDPTFDSETKKILTRFMMSSDEIKFAEHTPLSSECKKAHQTVTKWILGI